MRLWRGIDIRLRSRPDKARQIADSPQPGRTGGKEGSGAKKLGTLQGPLGTEFGIDWIGAKDEILVFRGGAWMLLSAM